MKIINEYVENITEHISMHSYTSTDAFSLKSRRPSHHHHHHHLHQTAFLPCK